MGLNLGDHVLVLAVVFLVFGVGHLPKLGEAIGNMRRNYRRSMAGETEIDVTPPEVVSSPREPSVSRTGNVEDAELVDEVPG